MIEHILSQRNKFLQPLSEEHREGLQFCWKIRAGIKKAVSPERLKRYTDWFYTSNLLPHFCIEEDFLFPLLGNDNILVKRALMEHRRLKRLFTSTSDVMQRLSLIEEELEHHLRFEEIKLMQEIMKSAPEHELDLIMKIHLEAIKCEDWGDPFWK